MKKPEAPYEASARSPFAGCAILIAAVAMMAFLIGFSIFALFRQFNEIAKFTAEKPEPVEISSLEDKDPELNNLAERLEKFRQDLSGEEVVSLALTVDELNLAIAAYEAFKELKGTLRVTAIDAETMRLAISFPLNGKPRFARDDEPGWIASDSRYLNATMVARPALLKNEIVLRIDTLEVPGATVPTEFIDQMSPYRLTERYLTDPVLGPAMARLTRVAITDGKLVLTRDPDETPADRITDEQVDAASSRLFLALGLAATVFLVFAGIIVFVGLRAKGRPSAGP